jgi:hypothetical protein
MTGAPSGDGGISMPSISDVLPTAVRTYGVPEGKKNGQWEFPNRGPSAWNLIFDTETTTDETQCPRLGTYQLRYGADLREQGLFFNEEVLSQADRRVLVQYAAAKRLKLIPLREFVETIFVQVAYHWQATTIGFNLPFDLSRLAEGHADARGKMRPGFSFNTTPTGRMGPRVRIKHLSRRASLIEFSGAGQKLPKGQRNRKVVAPSRRPAFVDVSTLAAALLSRTSSLGELAKYLNTPHQKLGTDEHGKDLTPQYLDYAVRDVQVTWECFVELRRRYAEHGLDRTPIHRILSEASIGKGYLREMGIRPWREMQRDFPPDLVGKIMATYFGGRTEVHERRVVMQVLYCDFTSMYPSVSTLMGLWRFVIAKGITWRDVTAETRQFIDSATLADLQRRETWQRLHVIVKIEPDGDILPVRAKYKYEPAADDKRGKHYTIGLNQPTADQPLWYTLADCVASKLLFGRAPKIIEAIAFEAGPPQDGLRPVAIAGNPHFRVDPRKDDLFKRLIELRMRTQGPERNALKLIANATGYGIFVQLDVNERSEPLTVRCYPAIGRQFLADMDNVEEPGEFFHPLLGTLITSAARLMLGIAEKLVDDAGLTWTFCDTDSMAIAKPAGMRDGEFFRRAQAVRSWFKPLNPYAADVDLFKIEDANFRIKNGKLTKKLQPVYCFAVSSKRYVLFNIDARGQPVIRKATAHGLGHLLPPYDDKHAPRDLPRPLIDLHAIGVNRWQHDFWHCIARAALGGNPDRPDFSRLPNFDAPAVSQYTATTAHLLRWFRNHNRNKPYPKQVRPFNFMLMYQPNPTADWKRWRAANRIDLGDSDPELPCVVAPYDTDLAKAAARCFDRDTGKRVPVRMLKSFRQTLAQYHLHPEPKFLNADYRDRGRVQRRHVKVSAVVYIGKEANRWEEQSYIGIDPEAEVTYGRASSDRKRELAQIKQAAACFGPTALARSANMTRQHLNAILCDEADPSDAMLNRLLCAAMTLELTEDSDAREARVLLAKVKTMGVRRCAALAAIDAGHLTRLISGERKVTKPMLRRLRRAVAAGDRESSASAGTEMQGN